MEKIAHIGMDTSKHVFQLHGVDATDTVVLRRKLRRTEMLAFFAAREPTAISIEACAGGMSQGPQLAKQAGVASGGSHHLARTLSELGYEAKLLAPQLVKPYVKRSKNDAANAEALCEAMSRPTTRFAPAKTTDQQATLMLVALRDRVERTRTQVTDAIRGHAAELRRRDKATAWLAGLLARKPTKLVAVALANRMARIAWNLMVSGETYAIGRRGATTAA